MRLMQLKGIRWAIVSLVLVLALISAAPLACAATDRVCRKVVLTGEVSGGQEWRAAIGEGWVLRLVPIAENGRRYTGWDLVLDALQDGGYPDALLLGTPPYGSLNEREIGTTYGLRAQDAIAWGPRRFHFLLSREDVKRGRELFSVVTAKAGSVPGSIQGKASKELLEMVGDPARVGAGEFVVQDARLVLGVGDPAAFAQQWALRLREVPHSVVPTARAESARGELQWIRFAVTLWVPAKGHLAAGMRSELVKCSK